MFKLNILILLFLVSLSVVCWPCPSLSVDQLLRAADRHAECQHYTRYTSTSRVALHPASSRVESGRACALHTPHHSVLVYCAVVCTSCQISHFVQLRIESRPIRSVRCGPANAARIENFGYAFYFSPDMCTISYSFY